MNENQVENQMQTESQVESNLENQNVTESMDDYVTELNQSFRNIKVGDILDVDILDITEDEVVADLHYFTQGVIPISEVSDDPSFKAMDRFKIGEVIKTMVISMDDGHGNIQLSLKQANQILIWDTLKEMLEKQTKAVVKIESAVNGGVVTFLEGIRAFIPASQLCVSYVEDLQEWVGKTVEAIVITVDEEKQKLVLSAKAVEKEKEEQSNAKRMSQITVGSILEGTVESLMPYGAFVRLDNGLSGLVHISKICMKRIKKPSEVLETGQKVKVKVLEMKDGKISLSIRDAEHHNSKTIAEVDEFEYKSEEIPNNPFGALLKDIMH